MKEGDQRTLVVESGAGVVAAGQRLTANELASVPGTFLVLERTEVVHSRSSLALVLGLVSEGTTLSREQGERQSSNF